MKTSMPVTRFRQVASFLPPSCLQVQDFYRGECILSVPTSNDYQGTGVYYKYWNSVVGINESENEFN